MQQIHRACDPKALFIVISLAGAMVLQCGCGRIGYEPSHEDAATSIDASIGIDARGTLDAGQASSLEVNITADNAYGFGYGDDLQLSNYFGGVANIDASDIFSCGANGIETYVVPPEALGDGTYLYIVAWADKTGSQGVLGQFLEEGKAPIYTGTGSWEVCGTDQDYTPESGGPSQEIVNQEIANCNATNRWLASDDTGQQRLEVGEDNSTDRVIIEPGNEFPITCNSLINGNARWMWLNWDVTNVSLPETSAFIWPGGGLNPDHEFLVFRLPFPSR